MTATLPAFEVGASILYRGIDERDRVVNVLPVVVVRDDLDLVTFWLPPGTPTMEPELDGNWRLLPSVWPSELLVLVRYGQRRATLSFDNEPVRPADRWRIPIIDPILEFLDRAHRALPGVHRPVGTWLAVATVGGAGACCFWASPSAPVVGLMVAILAVSYAETAGQRAWNEDRRSVPGLILTVGAMLAGGTMACIHFVLIVRRYLGPPVASP